MKNNAKKRGVAFSLTLDEYLEFVGSGCLYCGDEIDWSSNRSNLDRMDNNIGYEKLNVAPCCKFCNRTKSSHVPANVMVEFGRVIRSLGGWDAIKPSPLSFPRKTAWDTRK